MAKENYKDYSKFTINGIFTGGKGQTVYKVVKLYIKQNQNITFNQLSAVFSDSKIKRGKTIIIRKWEDEIVKKGLIGKTRRFFSTPIVLNNGQKVAVSNQWGLDKRHNGLLDNWTSFCELATDLGFKIKKISE